MLFRINGFQLRCNNLNLLSKLDYDLKILTSRQLFAALHAPNSILVC